MNGFDGRITAARGDLAAVDLRGKVDAENFVEGVNRGVVLGCAALRSKPLPEAGMLTELLFGESVQVYECKDGWAWLQAAGDSYVGYCEANALGNPIEPTNRVSVPLTPLLSAPNVKSPAIDLLPMNARVCVIDSDGRFTRVVPHGYVFSEHLISVGEAELDFVAVAESFVGTPYVWGGKTWLGLDCSGLIQTALNAAGISCQRDSDMQEQGLGQPLPLCADHIGYRRGDLVFWKGHAGIMLDEKKLLHANAHHMMVAVEPLAEAVARIGQSAGPIRAIKRLAQ